MIYTYAKTPERYRLFLDPIKGTEDIVLTKKQKGENVNFSDPVTAKSRPKIYLLKKEDKIIYVGYASQSIGTRLYQGLKVATYGYQWKCEKELELLVFVFADTFGEDDEANKRYRKYVEAIEAELVLLIRCTTNHWPKYQNEIHFNNSFPDEAREVATAMFEEVIKPL